MLVDDMPRSFLKRNNSYSHCPLKKRPVHVMLGEEATSEPVKPIKEEMVEEVLVVDEIIPEPENLSTKPEDLSRTASEKHNNNHQHNNNNNNQKMNQYPITTVLTPPQINSIGLNNANSTSPQRRQSPSPGKSSSSSSQLLLRSLRCSPSPVGQNQLNPVTNLHIQHHQNYPLKTITPPAGITPLHQLPKKARVEILQHDNNAGNINQLHFNVNINSANPAASSAAATTATAATPLEPLNLNTPIEPLPRYATPAWARTAPLFPPHYLPYPAAYRYHQTNEIYPAYPVAGSGAGYGPSNSPEHVSISPPPPHSVLTCPTIQRPVARSYAPWGSPDHCGLSPTSSLGSGSLRSPPPVSPEDLSSPGSDSGRSSAGSTSAGPIGGQKIIEKNVCSTSSSSSSSSSSSPRYQCPDCGKSYSTYSGLSKHQQFHCAAAEGQTKKSFSCKYCEKVYVSLGALKMHIRTHTLPCKCHLCGKAFSRPWLLQGHIRTHTGEKPFSCQHCNRAFADRSNLRAHLQTHSDVKKYSCSSCSKTFSRMSLLTKHQEGGCPGVAVPMAYAC